MQLLGAKQCCVSDVMLCGVGLCLLARVAGTWVSPLVCALDSELGRDRSPSRRLRRSDGSGQALPLQIQICDNGPGLPLDIRDEVFDPFVSGKENGTGLGLALASKIISDHDGWISVDSVPGNTVFTISLAAINIKNNSFIGEVN